MAGGSLGTGMQDLVCLTCDIDLDNDLRCNRCGRNYETRTNSASSTMKPKRPFDATFDNGAQGQSQTQSSQTQSQFPRRLKHKVTKNTLDLDIDSDVEMEAPTISPDGEMKIQKNIEVDGDDGMDYGQVGNPNESGVEVTKPN